MGLWFYWRGTKQCRVQSKGATMRYQSLTATAAVIALGPTLLCFQVSSPAAETAQALAAGTAQQVSANCTTDATGGDGVRHDCDSPASIINAPPNFVFNEHSVAGGETSGNGDEHSCALKFSSYAEVVPGTGIVQPMTASLTAHARSPSGHWSGRGWESCTYTIALVKYKQ